MLSSVSTLGTSTVGGQGYTRNITTRLSLVCVCVYIIDTCSIVGRHKILQCLIAVHNIFNSTEPYYILNNLYIKDYCIWIQQGDHAPLELISCKLNEVRYISQAVLHFVITRRL